MTLNPQPISRQLMDTCAVAAYVPATPQHPAGHWRAVEGVWAGGRPAGINFVRAERLRAWFASIGALPVSKRLRVLTGLDRLYARIGQERYQTDLLAAVLDTHLQARFVAYRVRPDLVQPSRIPLECKQVAVAMVDGGVVALIAPAVRDR